jgi:beta,beta-carotene 9',10'-dioxygenase
MKEVIPKGCRSITKETLEPEVSKIIGEVPAWLVGRLIRNGPAKWDLEDFTVNHVFDGYNMLTKFEIRGGESGSVSYTSKFLQSEAYKKANAMQKPVISEYGTRAACADSKKSVFARVISTLVCAKSTFSFKGKQE